MADECCSKSAGNKNKVLSFSVNEDLNLNPLEVIRLVSSLQLAVLYPKSQWW